MLQLISDHYFFHASILVALVGHANIKTLKSRRINYVNEKRHKKSDRQIATCPRRELNPHRPCGPQDFKSCVSTSFTTRARKYLFKSSRIPGAGRDFGTMEPKKNP